MKHLSMWIWAGNMSRNWKATLLCQAPLVHGSFLLHNPFCSTADIQKLEWSEVAEQQERPSSRNYRLAKQQLCAHHFFLNMRPAQTIKEKIRFHFRTKMRYSLTIHSLKAFILFQRKDFSSNIKLWGEQMLLFNTVS